MEYTHCTFFMLGLLLLFYCSFYPSFLYLGDTHVHDEHFYSTWHVFVISLFFAILNLLWVYLVWVHSQCGLEVHEHVSCSCRCRKVSLNKQNLYIYVLGVTLCLLAYWSGVWKGMSVCTSVGIFWMYVCLYICLLTYLYIHQYVHVSFIMLIPLLSLLLAFFHVSLLQYPLRLLWLTCFVSYLTIGTLGCLDMPDEIFVIIPSRVEPAVGSIPHHHDGYTCSYLSGPDNIRSTGCCSTTSWFWRTLW